VKKVIILTGVLCLVVLNSLVYCQDRIVRESEYKIFDEVYAKLNALPTEAALTDAETETQKVYKEVAGKYGIPPYLARSIYYKVLREKANPTSG